MAKRAGSLSLHISRARLNGLRCSWTTITSPLIYVMEISEALLVVPVNFLDWRSYFDFNIVVHIERM
ncbi:hypothetical protein ES703_40383 [subsurface metagenome]